MDWPDNVRGYSQRGKNNLINILKKNNLKKFSYSSIIILFHRQGFRYISYAVKYLRSKISQIFEFLCSGYI